MSIKNLFNNHIAEVILNRTSSFDLKHENIKYFNKEIPLIEAVRKYFLLLPVAGTDVNWRNLNKGDRKAIIRIHLQNVCNHESVNKINIDLVDTWLQNDAEDRRGLLSLYGNKLAEKYGSICFFCGKKIISERTVDHIFPFAKGGEDDFSNLMLLHKNCNASKNSLVIGEMMRWAPDRLMSGAEEIEPRTKFIAFLRDNFTCTTNGCKNGVLNKHEIFLKKRNLTGICCYDNIRTVCAKCYKN